MYDPLLLSIEILHHRVIRETLQMAVDKFEIRGLGDTVRQARAAIRDVRDQSAGLRDDTAALAATVRSAREAVNAAHEDLKTEINTLPNSPLTGESSSQQPEKPLPAGTPPSTAHPGTPNPPALGGYETANTANK